MERVIFWNNKGGTGKTTLAFQLLTEYANQNKEKKIRKLLKKFVHKQIYRNFYWEG